MSNSSSIILLKQKIKSEIVNDPLIVKAFGSPDFDSNNPDLSRNDISNNYIYTWNQIPDNITSQITYITLQVQINKYSDKLVKPAVEISIYSHNGHMELNPEIFPGITANRSDYLAQLLDEKFNGRTSLGAPDDTEKINLIGKLELTSSVESAYNNDFACRKMIFEALDVNSSLCDRR